MKKIVLPLLLACFMPAAINAQEIVEETYPQEIEMSNYNKWSFDFSGGFNKVAKPLSEGYFVKASNLFHADAGFRYMFNTKFGIKGQAGFDRINDDGSDPDFEFESEVLTLSALAHVNLGRIMQFEQWTNRINLTGHFGMGLSRLTNDKFGDADNMGNFILGMGFQYRLSNRIAFNADLTLYNTFAQDKTWNGDDYDNETIQGFDGTLYTGTIGFSIYLGKHEKHADWYVQEEEDKAYLEDMESRLGEMETMLDDSDKDGIPDYLDSEPNTITGVAVDTKGRTIDRNNNGVPDELESYIENQKTEIKQEIKDEGIVMQGGNTGGTGTGGGAIKELINGGYVNVYFDFNKVTPNAQSTSSINFLINYLKDNPSAQADVVGYADEVGNTEYNQSLSNRRAENVKKILVDAGIEATRLNVVAKGEDTSVNKSSRQARQVVRRVTFILK